VSFFVVHVVTFCDPILHSICVFYVSYVFWILQLKNQVARAMMTAHRVTLASTGSVSIRALCLILVHLMRNARPRTTELYVSVQVVSLETHLSIAIKVRIIPLLTFLYCFHLHERSRQHTNWDFCNVVKYSVCVAFYFTFNVSIIQHKYLSIPYCSVDTYKYCFL
jgi:hypothetical protein